MTKEDFIKTFLEGVSLSGENTKETLLYNLLGIVHDERLKNRNLKSKIDFMDDIAGDSGWSMRCRGCNESFQPDCELSEMYESEVYCGKNQWCTP